jgi:5S rRNA maturation endonuclease (ribonuclease M5)
MRFNTENLLLTKEYLELKYGIEAVFQFLFPYKISFSENYINPLRTDKNSGCKFFVINSELYFKDFSKGINYNWIKWGMTYKNLSYFELLRYVNGNLKNAFINNNKTIVNSKIMSYKKQIELIDILSDEFTQSDIDNFFTFYDTQCSIDLLKKGNIFKVNKYYYNNNLVKENCNNIFAFLNQDENGVKNYQLYFPLLDKSKRFRSCTTNIYPQFENIDYNVNYIFITKSNMDAFILKHILEFNTIGIINEGILLKRNIIEKLNKHFQIILLMDNDEAGRKCVIKYIRTYSDIKFKIMFVPFKYGKDIKDVVMNNKIEDVKLIINKKLKWN